jgi:hypothetical protein
MKVMHIKTREGIPSQITGMPHATKGDKIVACGGATTKI